MRPLHSPVVIALFAATAAAQSWALVPLVPTSPGPTTRRAGAMAFDAVSNRLIAYGGLSVSPSGVLAETWAFSAPPPAGTWTLLAPTGQSVQPRWGHRMVRNTVNNRLVTFGGRSPTAGSYANDTWEYTPAATGSGSWASIATAAAPAPRHFYGLAFDEARSVVVLFGGSSNNTTFDDTWEYDGTTWTERTLAVSPPAREDMVLVYDPALNRTVLFGGLDTDTNEVFGDTWLYDGTKWYEQETSTAPTARFSSSAVFDSFRKRVMLFGGYDGAARADTWQFAGDRWVAVPTTGNTPPNSTEAYSGYDASPTKRKMVLFGGFGTVFTNQTWELTVPTSGTGQSGLFGTFAPGCTVLENPPTIAAPAPVIGTPLNITFGDLPSGSVTLAVIGFSNRTWGAIPLPFDLGVLGFGSCDLLVAADVVASTPLTTPSSTLPVPIANNNALINAVIYTQGVVFDLVTGLSTTPPARVIIGN